MLNWMVGPFTTSTLAKALAPPVIIFPTAPACATPTNAINPFLIPPAIGVKFPVASLTVQLAPLLGLSVVPVELTTRNNPCV